MGEIFALFYKQKEKKKKNRKKGSSIHILNILLIVSILLLLDLFFSPYLKHLYAVEFSKLIHLEIEKNRLYPVEEL
jgi:hypothetical protein